MHIRQKGFTLIELLVVIAIIAILASILFPVFAQARESARLTQCLSNMKQIGQAMLMYADDYDETLPLRRDGSAPTCQARIWRPDGTYDTWTVPTRNWRHMIAPYVKNTGVYMCPTNPAARVPDEQASCQNTTEPRFTRGYFYYHPFFKAAGTPGSNEWWNGFGYGIPRIVHPATAILIGENKDVYPDYGPWMSYFANWSGSVGANFGARHRGTDLQSTILFADSHVKFTHWNSTCPAINPDTTNMWQYNPCNPNAETGGNPDIRWLNTFCYTLLNRAPGNTPPCY